MTVRTVQVETLADFDARIATTSRLAGWFVSSLDLTGRSAQLLGVDPEGGVFLGCELAADVADRLRAGGALVFPRLPDLPFDPYRASLYTADELYGTRADLSRPLYTDSLDAAVYAWSGARAPGSLTAELAATLHDHSISAALNDDTAGLDPRQVVGVMGGHALRRDEAAYASAAHLGAQLARTGRTVLTGGGPGAMEAANLGAYLSPWPDALPAALSLLARAPGYTAGVEPWLAAAFAVRARWPAGEAGTSLSVPTWFYGHEPTNPFATGIAKYFANALREDTLLHRCRGGIVYLPGQAGTVQEVFQAVTENFYALDDAALAPLVLVGQDYWTRHLPVWPLLRRLSEGRRMETTVHCVATVEQAVDLLTTVPAPAPPSPA